MLDLYLYMTRVHVDSRGAMDIVSQTIPWPAGLKEVDAKGTVLLQQAQSWELPGTVPEGIGGTTKAVGDAVRILASLSYSLFKKDPG